MSYSESFFGSFKYLQTETFSFSLIYIRLPHLNTDNSGGNGKLSTLRVLLVEDTVSQQKLMGKWLNGQGCEVTFAINGKIGLELLKTRQFDICLMDFLMVSTSSPFSLSAEIQLINLPIA